MVTAEEKHISDISNIRDKNDSVFKSVPAKKHLDYVDGIKGIGIWLIVLGHMLSKENLFKAYTYGFHVPIFFSVYGMTYKRPSNAKALWERRVKRVFSYAVTYFIWGLIYGSFGVKNILLICWGSDESIKAAGSMGTLWFLTSYFCSCVLFEIVMFLFIEKRGGELITFAIFLALAIAGFFIGKIEISPYRWPWGIDISLAAMLFPYFGYILKNFVMDLVEKKKILGVVFMLAGFGLCFITLKGGSSAAAGYVQMAIGEYGNFPAFIVAGCAGTVFIAMISYFMVKVKFVKNILLFVGQQSLIIMIVHREFSYFVSGHLPENTFVYGLLAVIITVFLACVSYVVSSILPFLAGKYGKTGIKLFGKEIQLIK